MYMKQEEILPILFARESYHGENIHLHKIDGKAILVGYKNERRWIRILTERVVDGTYNQPVTKIPYLVIEDDVYPLATFTEVTYE